MRTAFFLLGLSGLLALNGCTTSQAVKPAYCSAQYTVPDQAELLRDLNAAETRWHTAGLTNYQYDAQLSAFVPPDAAGPVRYAIQNGQTVSLTSLTGGSTAAFPADGRVETLFATIRNNVSQPFDIQSCEFFEAEYDPNDGHVTRVVSGAEQLADSGGTLTYTNFTRL